MVKKMVQFICNLCDATEHRLRYDYGTAGIYRCNACGLMSLHPRPTTAHLQKIYGEEYFRNQKFFDTDLKNTQTLYGYADYFAERANKQYQWNTMADDLFARCRQTAPDRRPRLLEIGCGMGYFLDTAHDVGFEVEGVEFNHSAVLALRSKYRFPIYEGAFPEIAMPAIERDVICALDVIEHLPDPAGAVRAMRSLLREGGLIVLVTMDALSTMSWLLGRRLEDFRRTSEHIYFFDRHTISCLLEQAGFELESITSIGHTFQVDHLLERLELVVPLGARLVRRLIWPRWLLKANIYIDPGTKICVIARKRTIGLRLAPAELALQSLAKGGPAAKPGPFVKNSFYRS